MEAVPDGKQFVAIRILEGFFRIHLIQNYACDINLIDEYFFRGLKVLLRNLEKLQTFLEYFVM